MSVARGVYSTRIREKLTQALNPSRLVLVDESHKHAVHREDSGLGETHFRLEIVSSSFEGEHLVARHRKVYDILKDELDERVHALSLSTKTSEEAPEEAPEEATE